MKVNGDAIRVIRIRTGHGLNSFARRLGITGATLSGIETGRHGASNEVIKAIAEALDVPLAAITVPECTYCRQAS